MNSRLDTERLSLRRFTHSDEDLLVELDSDPVVMRYLTRGASTPRQFIRDVVLPAFLRSYWPGEPYGVWATLERPTGEFVGWVSLKVTDPSERSIAHLGYRLRRRAWGKGYATEASRALMSEGFSRTGVQRILATTYEENLGSRRVMEKVGMRLVRRFRPTIEELRSVRTSYIEASEPWEGDDLEYAIERSEWQRIRIDR